MIQLEFGMEDMQALQEQRFDHPHPWVRRKLEAVYLVSGRKRPFFRMKDNVNLQKSDF